MNIPLREKNSTCAISHIDSLWNSNSEKAYYSEGIMIYKGTASDLESPDSRNLVIYQLNLSILLTESELLLH